MKQLLLLFAALAVLVIAGLVWAIQHLPWWQTVALIVSLLIAAKFAAGRFFTWALSIPFKWKGAVLKGATIQIHSFSPAPYASTTAKTAENHEESGEMASDAPLRSLFLLDLTLTPNEPTGKFTLWGPNELRLVKPESRLRVHGKDDEDDSCEIKRIEVEDEGQFKEDEGLSYAGPQRLKLLLAVQPGVGRLKFRYYFEEFGEVTLPSRSGSKVDGGPAQDKAA